MPKHKHSIIIHEDQFDVIHDHDYRPDQEHQHPAYAGPPAAVTPNSVCTCGRVKYCETDTGLGLMLVLPGTND